MGASSSAQEGFDTEPRSPHPWRAYQGNRFVDRERWADVVRRTWTLDQHEAAVWEAKGLDTLKRLADSGKGFPATASARMWRGVPDESKSFVWALASGSTVGCDEDQLAARYERDCERAFGKHIPESFERCPTFWGAVDIGDGLARGLENCIPFLELLRPEGITAARKLLWCCSQLWDVQFCPVLPVLVCLLLVFMPSEALVHAVVTSILSRATDDSRQRSTLPAWQLEELNPFPFLPLTKRDWGDVAKRAVGLLQAEMPVEAAHLVDLGVDLENLALRALVDGLATRLPFRTVCRLYGVFFSEGCEVFARYLVALWCHRLIYSGQLSTVEAASSLLSDASNVIEQPHSCEFMGAQRRKKSFPQFSTVEAAMDLVFESSIEVEQPRGGETVGVDDLSRLALQLRPSTSLGQLGVGDSPFRLGDRSDVGDDARIFCRPRLQDESSRFVWDSLWPYIWQWLPPQGRIRDPFLLFACYRDGYTASALLACCDRVPADTMMLLLLHVRFMLGAQGEVRTGVIGAFFPLSLTFTGGKYLVLNKCLSLGRLLSSAYVFRVVGEEDNHGPPQVWHWTGANDMLFCASDRLGILVGGEPALSVDEDLRRGVTRCSDSFGSPLLLPSRSISNACKEKLQTQRLDAQDVRGQARSSAKECAIGQASTDLQEEAIEYDVIDVEVFTLE